MQVKEKYPEGVFIYIVPPSMEVLSQRLHLRRTDSDAVIAKRLAKAGAELDWIGNYDYVIINDDLKTAVDLAASIIRAEECRSCRNDNLIASIKKMYMTKQER